MKQGLTEIVVVLDRSGSMGWVQAATIEGYNAFMAEQRKAPGDANVTLVQFNHEVEKVYESIPVADVSDLPRDLFIPRGTTSLLDAIGKTVTDVGARLAATQESDRPEKVLLVIITDGDENSSVHFNRAQILEMLAHQREVYSWQVVYLGANQDAIEVGASIGIPRYNAGNYASTPDGTRAMMELLSASTVNYRSSNSPDDVGFFKPDGTTVDA